MTIKMTMMTRRKKKRAIKANLMAKRWITSSRRKMEMRAMLMLNSSRY